MAILVYRVDAWPLMSSITQAVFPAIDRPLPQQYNATLVLLVACAPLRSNTA